VLEELGIERKDTLLVLNKIDAIADRARLEHLRATHPTAVWISARKREGLDRLASAVSDALSRSFRDLDVELGVDNGRMLAFLAAFGEILSRRYQDNRVTVHVRLPERHLGRLREVGVDVRPHAGNGRAAVNGQAIHDPQSAESASCPGSTIEES
jgi:GTP-binding protein HflX